MTRIELFLKLANPDSDGFSREVFAYEFVNEYSPLKSNNGYKWPESLKGKYEFTRKGSGSNWSIKLTGFCGKNETRAIKNEIRNVLKELSCEHTGFKGITSDPIEIDHRNGRYNQSEVLVIETQKVEDFMPLTRRSNLFKREKCKKCLISGYRFDAKELGFQASVTEGELKYEGSCEGCYWFGPKKFKMLLDLK
jgi:hypothetical protein